MESLALKQQKGRFLSWRILEFEFWKIHWSDEWSQNIITNYHKCRKIIYVEVVYWTIQKYASYSSLVLFSPYIYPIKTHDKLLSLLKWRMNLEQKIYLWQPWTTNIDVISHSLFIIISYQLRDEDAEILLDTWITGWNSWRPSSFRILSPSPIYCQAKNFTGHMIQ